MAHAKDAKAQGPQAQLGSLDLAQLFVGHWRTIGDSRGEARRRRLIPCGKPQRPGKAADGGLVEAGLKERASNTLLVPCAETETVISQIIRVRPIEDKGNGVLRGKLLHLREELRLTVKAAAPIVSPIRRVDVLASLNDGQGHPQRF